VASFFNFESEGPPPNSLKDNSTENFRRGIRLFLTQTNLVHLNDFLRKRAASSKKGQAAALLLELEGLEAESTARQQPKVEPGKGGPWESLKILDCESPSAALGPQVVQLIKPRLIQPDAPQFRLRPLQTHFCFIQPQRQQEEVRAATSSSGLN